MDSTSDIQRFYAAKSVLITGGTGFIGKILIEKILHSCPQVEKVYLLIRSSKGKSPTERLVSMVSEKPFSIRLKKEFAVSKLVAVECDLSEPGLGLSPSDRDMLVEKVHLVFHVAASVKFEAPLEVNMLHNVLATKQLLELASSFKQLKCFVHVSTAYSNCQLRDIDERVYPMEVPEDPMSLKVTEELIDKRPNTYTYTKAVAENVASQYAHKMNVVIARPSIVMSSLDEPAKGWTDTINGPIGLSMLGALGILQKIDVNTEVVFDLIPVDIVSNALVTIGWAATERRAQLGGGQVKVFNLTTGSENPCSFYHYFSSGRAEAYQKPSSRVLRPLLTIPRQRAMNSIQYQIHKLFSHLLFAYIVDFLLALLGQKRMVVRAVNRMHHASRVFEYFCSNQWSFVTDNVSRLRELQSDEDKQEFNCDVRKINWTDYAAKSWIGCRRFILKESDDTFESARKRYNIICLSYYIVKVVLALALILIVRTLDMSGPAAGLVLAPSLSILYLL